MGYRAAHTGQRGHMSYRGKQQNRVKRVMKVVGCFRSAWGRRLGLLGLIQVLGLLCLELVPTQAAPFAYITSQSNDSVSIIDTATNVLIRSVPSGGDEPCGVAVHPAGTFVYVTNRNPFASFGNLSIIDTATYTVVRTVQVGNSPFTVASHSSSSLAYVANCGSDTVSIIDTAIGTGIASVAVGRCPWGIAVHPTGTFVYVASTGNNIISVIDTSTNTVTATIPVEKAPYGVAVHPAGTFVYVTNRNNNSISIIDTSTNAVVATVPAGVGPFGVAVHPAGTFVYVTNGDWTVSVIDTMTNAVVATVPVGVQPMGVAVHPTGNSVYVANYGESTVSVIDTTTNTVIATMRVGGGPQAFGQFISPLPPSVPTLTLSLTGCTKCQAGDRLTVEAHVANPTPSLTPVEVKVGVRLPNGLPINLLGKHLEATLPPGLDTTLTLFETILPTGLPTGPWKFEGALVEPKLGKTLDRSTQPFAVLPEAR